MGSYRDRIETTQKEIAANEALIEADQRAVGKALVASEVDLSESSEELSAEADASQDLSSRIADVAEEIENVRAVLVERADARAEIEAKEAETHRHEESLPAIYEEIGKVSFERFRDNPFVDQEYAQVFSDLVKHHEEVKDVQTDLERLDSTMEQKPFLEKVVARGKRIVLANRLSAKESAERRLFRKVGKEITRTDFIQTTDDPSLSAAAAPYYDTEKRIEDLTHAVENLRSTDQKLSETLTAIVGEQRPDRFIAAREAERNSLTDERDASYKKLGQAVSSGTVEAPSEGSSLLTEIEELRHQNEEKRSKIERLQAALRVEELERQIERKTQTVDGLEQQIKSLEQQIADERKELEGLSQEKAEQEKARGPVESL